MRAGGSTAILPLRRLIVDDTGQDMVEYALLAALFGIVGLVAWNAVTARIAAAYVSYDAGQQGLWQPCDPGNSPC